MLGLIRTQELLAARRIDGAEQFFTRARDFGYSKSPDETLRIWGKDAVLADVVRGHPPLPARRDHHALLARAVGHARPPHRLGDAGAGGVPRRGRSAGFTPSSSRAASRPGRRGGSSGTGRRGAIKPDDDLSATSKARRRRLQPAARRVLRRDRRRQPQHAQEPGLRRRAIARADRRVFPGARRRRPKARPAKPASILDGDRPLVDAGFRAAAKHRRDSSRRARRGLRPAHARRRRFPALARDRRRARRRARRRLAGPASSARSASWCSPARACSSRRRRRTSAPSPARRVEVTATALARLPAAVKLATLRWPFAGQGGRGGRAAADARGRSRSRSKQTVTLPAELPATTPYWLDAPPSPGLYRDPRSQR